MTAYPISENAGAWWLVSGKARRLHAVPGPQISPEQLRDAIDGGRLLPRRGLCGLRRAWWYPGLGSRLVRLRCVPCCVALGITPGIGTPANNPPQLPEAPAEVRDA